eukprot:627465-Pyramimonas_sp.AAC.1
MPNFKAGLAILAPAQTQMYRGAVAELFKLVSSQISSPLAIASTGMVSARQAPMSFKDGEAVYLRKPGKGDGSDA